MLDWLIEGGSVVDGTGRAPFSADVGIRDGRIVAVGSVGEAARERIDARGAWVTPGFIDIHTHYDGQATWDETFSPSIHHGVTTVVMGNCGVGFAPVRPGHEGDLIKLMEGVEDIPGAALAESLTAAPPRPMTTEAELWYAVASVAMILSLAAAGWLVRRR
jgi:N-acyl-D-aspartate/D-glutamate deacylase